MSPYTDDTYFSDLNWMKIKTAQDHRLTESPFRTQISLNKKLTLSSISDAVR